MIYVWHAFTHKFNLLFMGASIIAGLFFTWSNPLFYPVLFAVESVLLIGAATNKRFQRAVDALEGGEKEKDEVRRMRNAIYGSNSAMKSKMSPAEDIIRQIKQNTRQNSKASVQSSEAMLSGLGELEKNFILLLNSYCRLDDMQKTAGTGFDGELDKLKAEQSALAADAPAETRDALAKRIELVEKRAAIVRDGEANKKKLIAQVEMIEETFKYLRDQSVQVFDPQTIAKQVDAISTKMETTRQTLTEIEKYSAQADYSMQQARVR
ncbi:MAG: hypothetical protein JSR44_09730 [Spirochaetes bacterium]|nr:hypothetical protein [Spirochaetota bacterium]